MVNNFTDKSSLLWEKKNSMKLAHYDDGKHKWMSHEVFLKEDDNFYCKEFDLFSHNITDVRGYGETKGEALQDLKNKLDWLFEEYKALEKMIFETDVLENNMIEVDCFDKELAN